MRKLVLIATLFLAFGAVNGRGGEVVNTLKHLEGNFHNVVYKIQFVFQEIDDLQQQI